MRTIGLKKPKQQKKSQSKDTAEKIKKEEAEKGKK